MSRYYFNLHNDVIVDDEEGTELPDAEAARQSGLSQARDLVGRLAIEEGKIDLAHHIKIVDQSGALVSVILFAEVVEVAIAGRPII